MSFEMKLLIMYHVHHLSMELEGKKKPTKVSRSTNQTSPIMYLQDVKFNWENNSISAVAKSVILTKWLKSK